MIEMNRTMTTAAVIVLMFDAMMKIEVVMIHNVLIHYVTTVVNHNDYYESIGRRKNDQFDVLFFVYVCVCFFQMKITIVLRSKFSMKSFSTNVRIL